MYGSEGTHDLPETGIVLENNSDADFMVRFEGSTIKTVSVSSGETSSAPLPPGTYRYIISAAEDTQHEIPLMSYSKALKRERPIKALTGEKTVREKCRTTFDVFLEKKAVE